MSELKPGTPVTASTIGFGRSITGELVKIIGEVAVIKDDDCKYYCSVESVEEIKYA